MLSLNGISLPLTLLVALSLLAIVRLVSSPAIDIPKWPSPHSHSKRATNKAKTILCPFEVKPGEASMVVNISIGTPPQQVRLNMSTTLADTWVMNANSPLCLAPSHPCDAAGTSFAGNLSSTYKNLSTSYNLSLTDGSTVTGAYATDTFGIGGVQIGAQQFVVADNGTKDDINGTFGLGSSTLEEASGLGQGKYPNVPDQMVQQGLINTPAFSIYFNDSDGFSGSVLFGGVDTERYNGSLAHLTILRSNNNTQSPPLITLNNLDFNGVPVHNDVAANTYLDSEGSLIQVSQALYTSVIDSLGATLNKTIGFPYLDCESDKMFQEIGFDFGSARIGMPVKNMLMNLDDGTESHCYLCNFRNLYPSYTIDIADYRSSSLVKSKSIHLGNPFFPQRIRCVRYSKPRNRARPNTFQRHEIQYCGDKKWHCPWDRELTIKRQQVQRAERRSRSRHCGWSHRVRCHYSSSNIFPSLAAATTATTQQQRRRF
jgi:hypothetical protein